MKVVGLMDGYTGVLARNVQWQVEGNLDAIFTEKRLRGKVVNMLHVQPFDPNFLLDKRYHNFMESGVVKLDGWLFSAIERIRSCGGAITLYQTINTSDKAGETALRTYLFAVFKMLEELGVEVKLLQYEALRNPKAESQWSLGDVSVWPGSNGYSSCSDSRLLAMHRYRMKKAAAMSVPLGVVPVGASFAEVLAWYTDSFLPEMFASDLMTVS